MGPKENTTEHKIPAGHIIFDHDGTLVNTEHFPAFLFDGIRELLIELKSKGFELYVWTSRPRRSTLESLGKFDIQQFFSDIYCYDDGLPKPNPMGLERLTPGLQKNKILHIGDSYTDLEGAKAYGIEVVLACWNNADQVNKYHDITDYTALNFIELREVIKGKFYV
ncbi:MAG: HAD family hydrolase [Bacteriovorax sp.]|nr:HAD family hydrolase [Bacteriovorax sp.]